MADRDFRTRCGGKTLPRIISISKQPTDSNGYFFFFFAPFILMQRLQIMDSENLVQVDTLNRIKWQSFNFPTGLMLWGQRLNVASLLTSFSSNSNSFYSLEIHYNKIALYLNLSKWNYSYWEFKAFQKQEHHICQSGFNGITVIQLSVLVVM
jgi:hypothetical protein